MINDRLISGAAAGMIAAPAKTLINILFHQLGVTRHTYPNLIAEILLKIPKGESFTFWPYILGIVVDIIIGGIVGIIIIYTLEVVNRRFLFLKGIIFGNLVWLVGPTILLPLIYPDLRFGFHLVSLVDHWVLGLTLVILIEKFEPNIRTNNTVF